MNSRIGINMAEKTLTVPKNDIVCYCIEDYDMYALDVMLNCADYTQGNDKRLFIPAIKYFRLRFGIGLKEAKDAVELYAQERIKQREDKKKQEEKKQDKPVQSLGALLKEKMDGNQNRDTTDQHGYIQCIFRLLGHGDWQTTGHEMRVKILRFYEMGNSSKYAADYCKDTYNL